MRNFRWTLEGSGMKENSHQHWFIWCPRRWNAKIVISKMLRSTAAVDDPAFYAHHIKCPRSEFIHEKSSWIVQRQKEHRRNPFTGRLSRGGLDSHSGSFLLYFIVSFSYSSARIILMSFIADSLCRFFVGDNCLPSLCWPAKSRFSRSFYDSKIFCGFYFLTSIKFYSKSREPRQRRESKCTCSPLVNCVLRKVYSAREVHAQLID